MAKVERLYTLAAIRTLPIPFEINKNANTCNMTSTTVSADFYLFVTLLDY